MTKQISSNHEESATWYRRTSRTWIKPGVDALFKLAIINQRDRSDSMFWSLRVRNNMILMNVSINKTVADTNQFKLIFQWINDYFQYWTLIIYLKKKSITAFILQMWNKKKAQWLALDLWKFYCFSIDSFFVIWSNHVAQTHPECRFHVSQGSYLYQLGDCSEQWPWRKWWWGATHTAHPQWTRDGGRDGGCKDERWT